MIKCPDCGEQAPDEAKFCDRCGRGLGAGAGAAAAAPLPTRPAALAPGTVLKGGFEILATLAGTSIENRYRARRIDADPPATAILRERFGPEPAPAAEAQNEAIPTGVSPQADTAPLPAPDDPNGPRAKTAELPPIAAVQPQPAEADLAGATDAAPTADETAQASEVTPTAPEITEPSAETLPPDSAAVAGNGSAPTQEQPPAQALAEPVEEAPAPDLQEHLEQTAQEDLGEVFGRVMALSMTLTHPAFQRADAGFADHGRVYLVYADEALGPMPAAPISEPEAISAAIQVCQAIGFVHRRGLRLNDICPLSVAVSGAGRIKMTGLEYVSNDNERQAEPVPNDGYTAPEIYRGRKVDKRADVFSAGALLYTWVTGDRIETESWREEAGSVRFYPPHVVTPELEQAILRAIQFEPAARWATIDEFKAELTRLMGQYRVRVAALTDVGMVRDHNEDAVMIVEYVRDSLVEPDQNHLCVVCDGMGGAEAGEVAAAIAVATIRDYVETRLPGTEVIDPGKLMSAALEEANSKILEYVAGHQESRGMGSTGVTALVTQAGATVAWVGDSRGYFLEGGALRQVTKDHSLVQRLIDIGQITPAEARTHEHKNVITRSLGARQSGPAGAEAIALKLRRGDRMMLCSDGLTTHVEDKDIAVILRRHRDPFEAARELIAAANAGGGTDNISVIVIYAS
ncbi:MAG TPA: Stp1/IreP family PP2C-type Ser/Thr phosphatase [Candidatus Binataceae bacterium]|nr:Stp1/IreP family PP2C-type Ser/Thr phosphatase [Candidatus Binataceae bacterium]